MKMSKRYYQILIGLLISVSIAYSGNKLTVVRTATNALEVQLANSDAVAGVQFSMHTSSDVVLGELEHGTRTAESHWIVASYKPNDSTVNVVILSLEQKAFPIGQGALVRFPISLINPLDKSNASLANVMVTNSQADSLGVAINNLEWSNNSTLASNNDSKSTLLGQNYPNPFNPSTRIAYQLLKAAQVQLSVYDITGREVNRLVDQYQPVGDYSVEWSSNATSGQKLSSGVYFARLIADNESATRKMIMTK
ncbi:MAG: T9SS type A sorting domain-containing protein [Ignavibacteriales bacterium]|nr:T9SS type A sorting domain-containing protein [Ignavibacteriales bacterium]